MEDEIEIFKGLFIGWKKYKLILSENILTYYNKKGKIRKIHLKISILKEDKKNQKVLKLYTGINRFKLKFKTKEDKIKWFNAIEISKTKNLKDEVDRRAINNISNSSIEDYDSLKSDIDNLLDKKNIIKIKENLNYFWNIIADFNDNISQLLSKIYENTELKDLYNKLLKINNELKNNLTINANLIEEEKEKLKVLFKYLSQIEDIKTFKEEFKDIKKKSMSSKINYEKNKKKLNEDINVNDFESVLNHNNSELFKEIKLSWDINNEKINSNSIKNIDVHDNIKDLIETHEVFKKYPLEIDNSRKKLKVLVPENQKFSIITIIKNSIGKDLSKMAIPVFMNEPLSFLQRQCELFEYSEDIFPKFLTAENDYWAMIYLMGFSFISYAHTINRVKKPFNPLLGETFNYEIKSINLKVIFEQVSHHPPICAYYAENDDLIVEGHTHMYSKLSIRGFDVTPKGPIFITNKKNNVKYEINRAKTHLHNYLFGEMYVWHTGKIEVKNLTTNKSVELNFQNHSLSKNKRQYLVNGIVFDEKKNVLYNLEGKWDSYLNAIEVSTNKVINIVTRHNLIENFKRQYYLTEFSLGLNYLNNEIWNNISPNDSRLRLDQRCLEFQDYDLANKYKSILEDSQRNRKKERDIKKEKYKPKFFELVDNNYKYLNNFYDCLNNKDWECLENIYN